MKEKITWPTKVIALSFIGLIVLTNIWLHFYLFGGEMPEWANIAVDICTLCVFVGALAQTWYWFKKRFLAPDDDDR